MSTPPSPSILRKTKSKCEFNTTCLFRCKICWEKCLFIIFKYLKHLKILAKSRISSTPSPPLTQSSALDLLREDFHSTLNHVSVSHPPQQPNPQHSHFYNPQPNNPAIDLPPTVEKSFFQAINRIQASYFRFLYLMNILFPLIMYLWMRYLGFKSSL